MRIDRRHFLEMIGVTAVVAGGPGRISVLAKESAASTRMEPADYTILIGTGLVELATDHTVSTTLYNGQFPGPLIRFKEGQRAVVDIYNDSDVPELVHWHGQMIPSDVDGAAEEGSPFVTAMGMRRIAFVPKPQGFRFCHTHVVPGADLYRGTYTGQAGPVYIEPKNDPGAYDREVFLVMKEFEPSFSRGGDMDVDMLAPGTPIKGLRELGAKADEEAKGTPKGYEVGYGRLASTARCWGPASRSASDRVSRCSFTCSMPAPPRLAAWRSRVMCFALWRLTAIRFPRRPMCLSFGSVPRSASRPSWK